MALSRSLKPRHAVSAIHSRTVFGRRIRVLSSLIGQLIPDQASVLDVGCGSGDLARALLTTKPNLSIEGVDVLVRPNTAINVQEFDGANLPYGRRAFDYALLIDVLHHTDNQAALLAEVCRVASHVVIKDHYRNGFMARSRLRFMDWVGNAPHGVRLPYNYLSRNEWAAMWLTQELRLEINIEDVPLYPFPASWLFGRRLHFIAKLVPS